MDNILIWIIVLLLIWQAQNILQFVMLLIYEFKKPKYKLLNKDTIDSEILEIVKPYDEYLRQNGFEFKSALEKEPEIVGSNLITHTFYYYNPVNHIHAFVNTTPYKEALEPVRLTYETIFKSQKLAISENGFKHFIISKPKEVYLFDHYLSSWKDSLAMHLKDRQIEGQEIAKGYFKEGNLKIFLDYLQDIFYKKAVDDSLLKKSKNGYKFKANLKTLKFAMNMVKKTRQFAKILKQKPSQEVAKSGSAQALLTQIKQLTKPIDNNKNKKKIFLISAIAFIALFTLIGIPLVDVLIIAVVLIVHELGHYLAMRYFGYVDTNIFFLPFGAATVGDKAKRSAFEEYIVYLMGPLPGIIIGFAIIAYELIAAHQMPFDTLLSRYAIFSIVINFFNLLPIYPLDGGRILQTLLLLRYPKGQFYFYLIGFAILAVAMVVFKDPLLLIFVVVLAIGISQSYKISKLLTKIFKKHSLENIDEKAIVSTLLEDEKFSKESLTSQAKIAKSVLTILNTKRASKKLLIFGLSFYILLLIPAIGIIIGPKIFSSPYDNLSKADKKEVDSFYKKVYKLKQLGTIGDVNYTMQESMKELDKHFKNSKIKRKIAPPLAKIDSNSSKLSCPLSSSHLKLLKWHNGIDKFIPYEALNSYKEVLKYKKDGINYVVGNDDFALVTKCGKKGIYNNFNNTLVKEYYNFNHFLKITAEAYKRGAYLEIGNKVYLDIRKFNKIKREFLSKTDKKKYQELIKYLQKKAIEYKNRDKYLQTMLLYSIYFYDEPRLVDTIKLYLNSKDKDVKKAAIIALGFVGNETTLPLLLKYTNKNFNNSLRADTLLSIYMIVNKNSSAILNKIYPLLNSKDEKIKIASYSIIEKIANKDSLNVIREHFKTEKSLKLRYKILNILAKIGNKEDIKMLEQDIAKLSKKKECKKLIAKEKEVISTIKKRL